MTYPGKIAQLQRLFHEGVGEMTLNYAGRSHDEAVAARHKQKQKAQEQAGGEMAIEGTEADAEHSCGELSERGKQVWRSGSGINGGGKEGSVAIRR
jgi:hypothetical protein